ncbi:MAG: hypothetical protein HYX66_02625 [Ignavibacteria bacterium]|nr:hypothetical protein [Ignavibacteria bacterium]
MSIRGIAVVGASMFMVCSIALQADVIVVSVDSVSPSVPIFFENEIFSIDRNIDLKDSYELVFNRENYENSKWLLVTPPPNMDPTAELIARQLRFAWSPLSDGLRLVVKISTAPVRNVYDRSISFLSSQSLAFVCTVSQSELADSIKTASNTPPAYDAERFNRLLKRNSLERNGKIDGNAEVAALVSNDGYVHCAVVIKSSNSKLDVPALRTVMCTRFAVLPGAQRKMGYMTYKITVTISK